MQPGIELLQDAGGIVPVSAQEIAWIGFLHQGDLPRIQVVYLDPRERIEYRAELGKSRCRNQQ